MEETKTLLGRTNLSLTEEIVAQASLDPDGISFLWAELGEGDGEQKLQQRTRCEVISDAMEIVQGLRCLLEDAPKLRQNVIGVAIAEGYHLLLCQLALLISGNIYVPLDLVSS